MMKPGIVNALILSPVVRRPAALTALLFVLLCGLSPEGAFAQDAQGRNWAGACTGCHGSEGRSSGVIPSIAAMDKERFVRLMAAFRDGTQSATLMNQIARGLNDAQIDKLADYFASRAPVGEQEK